MNGRPNDQRNLIHKKIAGLVGGAAGRLIPGVSVIQGVVGVARSLTGGGGGGSGGCGSGRVRNPITGGCSAAPVSSLGPVDDVLEILGVSGQRCAAGRSFNPATGGCSAGFQAVNGAGGPCADPQLVRDADGVCRFPGSPSGGLGELRKGRFGPAEEPMFVARNVRFCLDGFILGKDALCYKKGSISNKERLYPKGRPPLLTGGDMSAIAKAARAAGKLKRTTKRLEAIGLIKKPTRRSIPSGHRAGRLQHA